MWILLVVRLMHSNGDMMLSQEFATEQTCKNAGAWISQQEGKKYFNNNITWACLKK